LKETGRSIDGNWMVWIRKLDDLLTETGWSIDGNWTENVKSIDGISPADFLYFGGLKMRFCRVPKPAVSILGNRKFDFCRVVKPRVTKSSAFWQPENAISADS